MARAPHFGGVSLRDRVLFSALFEVLQVDA